MSGSIDQKVTIVKVKASRYIIHIEADLTDDRKVVWFEAAHIHQAPWVSFSCLTP